MKYKLHPVIIFVVSIVLLLVLPLSFNIGKTADKNLGTDAIYKAISQIPDGSVVIGWSVTDNGFQGTGGREQVGIMYYDNVSNKKIVPFNIDAYSNGGLAGTNSISSIYSAQLRNLFGMTTPLPDLLAPGVKYTTNELDMIITNNMALLMEANPNREFFFTHVIDNYSRELIKLTLQNGNIYYTINGKAGQLQ